MSKILKLFTYVDGVNDTPFPSDSEFIELASYQYDSARMGATPTINATIMFPRCLDNEWTENVYAEFDGQKYFIRSTPTSSKNNTDARYKHELNLVSYRVVLENVYFFDIVSDGQGDYKPVTNSTKFNFFGTIEEFAKRIENSIKYSKLDFKVVVDSGITSDAKLVSFQDKVLAEAIQESYNVFNIPYYFEGNTIHFGYSSNTINEIMRYGVDDSLLSISKNNANFKVVNRITGLGSSENIPYYYPNPTEKGIIKGVADVNNTSIKSNDIEVTDIVTFSKKVGLNEQIEYVYLKLDKLMSFYSVDGGSTKEYNESNDVIRFEVTYRSAVDIKITNSCNINTTGDNEVHISVIYDGKNLQKEEIYKRLYGIKIYDSNGNILSYKSNGNVIEFSNSNKGKLDVNFSLYFDGNDRGSHTLKVSTSYIVPTNQYSWAYKGSVISLGDVGLRIINQKIPDVSDKIIQVRERYIATQDNLMPSIYRDTNGEERFYNALNNTYPNNNGGYYHFNHPYIDGKQREHIVSFPEIKPTIEGATNKGQRIDMFSEFAYDIYDNDEQEEKGGQLVYKHPYFFAKLRKLPFNLFDHALEGSDVVVSMTGGTLGGCNFTIGVNEENKERHENLVQVDDGGNLLYDKNGNVRCGRENYQGKEKPQQKQNDTINNEVWIALKKDINYVKGEIMPNAEKDYRGGTKIDALPNNYVPYDGTTFVLLGIRLPLVYITNAEDKLEKELIKYMSENNDEKFTFSISFSRIYFAEHLDVLEKLNENSLLNVEYNGQVYQLYVKSYSYRSEGEKSLPEIRVELSDTITIQQNALQNSINEVKQEIINNSGNVDVRMISKYFIRKDVDDVVDGNITFRKNINVRKNIVIGDTETDSCGRFFINENKESMGETDYLNVRKKAEIPGYIKEEDEYFLPFDEIMVSAPIENITLNGGSIVFIESNGVFVMKYNGQYARFWDGSESYNKYRGSEARTDKIYTKIDSGMLYRVDNKGFLINMTEEENSKYNKTEWQKLIPFNRFVDGVITENVGYSGAENGDIVYDIATKKFLFELGTLTGSKYYNIWENRSELYQDSDYFPRWDVVYIDLQTGLSYKRIGYDLVSSNKSINDKVDNNASSIQTISSNVSSNKEEISILQSESYDNSSNISLLQECVAVPFDGFVRGATIEQGQSALNIDKILFDSDKNKFVCLATNGKYYTSWFGREMYNEDLAHLKVFLYNGHQYRFTGVILEDQTEKNVIGISKKSLKNITFPPSGQYQIDVENDGYSYRVYNRDSSNGKLVFLPDARLYGGIIFSFLVPHDSVGKISILRRKTSTPQLLYKNGSPTSANGLSIKVGMTDFLCDGDCWYQLNNL